MDPHRRFSYGRPHALPPVPPIRPRSTPPLVEPLAGPSLGYPWIMNAMPAPVLARPAPPGVLYPFVAVNGSPVRFDLRKNPRKAKQNEFILHNRYSLFSQPVTKIRLVCREFPWPIEIKDEWVLCGTIWEKMYRSLQENMMESEWAMASEARRRKIEKAVRWREAESGNRMLRPKRIDWLGEKTFFAGLEKDDAYVEEISMPARENNMETWVIRLARR